MLFKTIIFCSKVPSESGKCRFRDPKFKKCPGIHAPGPPMEMCCHFTLRVHGPLPAWNGKASQWVPVQACRGETKFCPLDWHQHKALLNDPYINMFQVSNICSQFIVALLYAKFISSFNRRRRPSILAYLKVIILPSGEECSAIEQALVVYTFYYLSLS